VLNRSRIQYKTPEQIRVMRRAGLVVARTLTLVRERARAGLSTGELNAAAERSIRAAGATPSFLGYGEPPFIGSVCLSVNDEIVHGLPGSRVLAHGDVLSVDCGAIVDGWHGDAAFSMIVGQPAADEPSGHRAATDQTATDQTATDPADVALLRDTEDAMWAGIAALAVGRRLHQVGAAVEDRAEAAGQGYGIVEEYVGHGIGTQMHQDPQVPNYRVRDKGVRVRSGLVVAVEPMLTRGSAQTKVLDDGWTVVTADGSRAAHFEHTVAVTDNGLWVLTALDGGRQRLAQAGATFGPLD
jgi:methionyl aminopeptidase